MEDVVTAEVQLASLLSIDVATAKTALLLHCQDFSKALDSFYPSLAAHGVLLAVFGELLWCSGALIRSFKGLL